jgi:23S rRNA pseudouridine1911/1915/1917 synthase
MDAVFSFEVDQALSGFELLEHLPTCIPYLSEVQCMSLLLQGGITIDGQVISDNLVMLEGQSIAYTVPDYKEGEVDTRWQLLWQNGEIAAVHKPSNLPVSRTTRNVYNTLIQILRRESPWPDAHLLHRLDLETSGIILIGQNKASASKHQPNLPHLIQRKIYHAIVKGSPSWDQLDYQCDLNTSKDSPIRCQMHKVEKGKTSQTKFTVLKSNGQYSIVECELMTGRKHQIRAHLSILGHPIVGDKIYSNQGDFYLKRLKDETTQADEDALITPHHLLHAYQVHINPDECEQAKPVVLTDTQYSDAWMWFIKEQGL